MRDDRVFYRQQYHVNVKFKTKFVMLLNASNKLRAMFTGEVKLYHEIFAEKN